MSKHSFNIGREYAIKAVNFWTYFKISGMTLSPKDAPLDIYGNNSMREVVRLSREVDMGQTVFREADVPFEVTLEWLCEMLEQKRLFLNS